MRRGQGLVRPRLRGVGAAGSGVGGGKDQTVYIREILETRKWAEHKGHLPVAFGKDIAGKPVYGDLAKMPHLLVAGAGPAGPWLGRTRSQGLGWPPCGWWVRWRCLAAVTRRD